MHKATIAAVVLLTGVLVFAGQEPAVDRLAIEKAVLEAHAGMIQAEKALDADRFFEYILDYDKGLIIQDGKVFRTRQEAFDAVKAGFQRLAGIERTYDQTFVNVISPDTALVTAQGTSSVTLQDGRKLNIPFAASSLFVLRDGRWKLLHGHYSTPNGG